jgi:hypothetical protein
MRLLLEKTFREIGNLTAEIGINFKGVDMEGKDRVSRCFDYVQNEDYSGKDLQESDFFSSTLDGVNFTNSDLRRSDFRNTTFKNVAITLGCRTFDEIKLDRITVLMLLKLITTANISNDAYDESEVEEAFIRMKAAFKKNNPVKLSDLLKAMISDLDNERIDAFFQSVQI